MLGHIPGKAKAAADYLSRIHLNPHNKIQMRFNSKLPVREVTLSMQLPDNSFNSERLDCEILMTPDDLRKYVLN